MSEVDCICTCARAHPRFPDLAKGWADLANGWADRVQILCVKWEPLDKSFTHV